MSTTSTVKRVPLATGVERPAALLQIERGTKCLVLAKAADVAALEGLEGQFDAAVVDGVLEDEPTDRWVLQRVHRLLRMGAPIVVTVPPLASLMSAFDLPFLAYASRQLLVQLLERWKPGAQLPGPVHRRYLLQRLVRKMEWLGYTDFEPGPGWPGGRGARGAPWLARRASLTARKGPSLWGVKGRSWPDAQLHRRRYAERFAAIPAARDAWLARFPEFRALAPRALDPSAWREARVLVLAPHPDDELIGCGGTLCRLVRAGAKATILYATDGCRLESLRSLPHARRKSIRLEEAARVAAELGAERVLWRREDARLRCTGGTVARLARLLADLRPTHVFTPFLGDLHADHHALSRILGGALARAGIEPQVLQYEVWSLVPANLYCDITEQAEDLERLLLLYDRAMQADDFVHSCADRNLARALELTGRPAYVEAFLSTTGADYCRLAAV